MNPPGTNSTAPPGTCPTHERSAGSDHQSLQVPSPVLVQEPLDRFNGWKTIGEQEEFYHEQDCLHPSHTLVSEKLKSRREDDVVIFDYSLDPHYLSRADGNPFEESDSSSGHFSEEEDIFFPVSKDRLIESEQFDRIISPMKDPLLIRSRGLRLAIM